jgi:hypothetical protein
MNSFIHWLFPPAFAALRAPGIGLRTFGWITLCAGSHRLYSRYFPENDRQPAVATMFHPHRRASQSRGDIRPLHGMDFAFVLQRVIGFHLPRLHMAQDRCQIVLRLPQPVCVIGRGWYNGTDSFHHGRYSFFQVAIGFGQPKEPGQDPRQLSLIGD